MARLHRLDYADNDQGPDTSTQHDIPREIRKETRECSGQVHGSKSFFPFPSEDSYGSQVILTPINFFPIIGVSLLCIQIIGGPSTSLSRAKLAGRRWRDHKRTSYTDRGRTRHAGQLATHPPTQSLCISAMPTPPWTTIVGLILITTTGALSCPGVG